MDADLFENNTKARGEREIKSDLTTLDPEMVGNLVPPSKTTFDGKPAVKAHYAELPCVERLRVSGKIEETEDNRGDEGGPNGEERKRVKRAREANDERSRRRKNVIDRAVVCFDIDFADPSCHLCQAGEAERREVGSGYCHSRKR